MRHQGREISLRLRRQTQTLPRRRSLLNSKSATAATVQSSESGAADRTILLIAPSVHAGSGILVPLPLGNHTHY